MQHKASLWLSQTTQDNATHQELKLVKLSAVNAWCIKSQNVNADDDNDGDDDDDNEDIL